MSNISSNVITIHLFSRVVHVFRFCSFVFSDLIVGAFGVNKAVLYRYAVWIYMLSLVSFFKRISFVSDETIYTASKSFATCNDSNLLILLSSLAVLRYLST